MSPFSAPLFILVSANLPSVDAVASVPVAGVSEPTVAAVSAVTVVSSVEPVPVASVPLSELDGKSEDKVLKMLDRVVSSVSADFPITLESSVLSVALSVASVVSVLAGLVESTPTELAESTGLAASVLAGLAASMGASELLLVAVTTSVVSVDADLVSDSGMVAAFESPLATVTEATVVGAASPAGSGAPASGSSPTICSASLAAFTASVVGTAVDSGVVAASLAVVLLSKSEAIEVSCSGLLDVTVFASEEDSETSLSEEAVGESSVPSPEPSISVAAVAVCKIDGDF